MSCNDWLGSSSIASIAECDQCFVEILLTILCKTLQTIYVASAFALSLNMNAVLLIYMSKDYSVLSIPFVTADLSYRKPF